MKSFTDIFDDESPLDLSTISLDRIFCFNPFASGSQGRGSGGECDEARAQLSWNFRMSVQNTPRFP